MSTVLYWRKYYVSVRDLFVILITLQKFFKWCFQRPTFTLFSSVRETINFVFSWPEWLENLSLLLLDCQLKSETAVLFLLVHPALNAATLNSVLFFVFEFFKALSRSFNSKKTDCNIL